MIGPSIGHMNITRFSMGRVIHIDKKAQTLTNITNEDRDRYDEMSFDDYREECRKRIWKSKSDLGFWDYAREVEQIDDTMEALKELHEAAIKGLRRKKENEQETSGLRIFCMEVQNRITGCNKVIDRRNNAIAREIQNNRILELEDELRTAYALIKEMENA